MINLKRALWLGGLGLLALSWTGCGLGGTKPATANPAKKVTYSAAVRHGGELYVEYACIRCHGPEGRGGVPDPVEGTMVPTLVGFNSHDTRLIMSFFKSEAPGHFYIAPSNGVENGWINMPNWGAILTDGQMNDLASYIEAGLPDLGVKPLPARTGPEIFRAFACIKCHGKLDVGGIVDPVYPPSSGDHLVPTLGPSQYPGRAKTDGPNVYRDILMNGSIPHHNIPTGYPGTLFMPAWGHILTPTQLRTILNYIQYGH